MELSFNRDPQGSGPRVIRPALPHPRGGYPVAVKRRAGRAAWAVTWHPTLRQLERARGSTRGALPTSFNRVPIGPRGVGRDLTSDVAAA